MNTVNVKVIGLGTSAAKIEVTAGDTIAVAMDLAAFDGAGMDIRLNGKVAEATDVITEDSTVALVPPVEGGLV